MRYYTVDSDLVDIDLQRVLVSATVNRSKGGKSNSLAITLNNPIVSFFPNGVPRRQFVDEYGNITFKATSKSGGYFNFEERIEIFAKFVTDPQEDVTDESNLLFSGQILSVKTKHTSTLNSITLDCSDRTFNLLNRLTSAKFLNTGAMRSYDIIQGVVRTVTEANGNLPEYYDENGNRGSGIAYKYAIDARTFTQGRKVLNASVSSSASKTITASGATFITNGVQAGDMIRNNSNYTVAIVTQVISETSLKISKAIFLSAATCDVSNGFIVDFRPDGTAVSPIVFSLANKPTYEWVETLCQADYWANSANETIARPLEFYVDGRNRLHVFHPDNNASHEVDTNFPGQQVGYDTNAHICYETSFEKNVYDTINFIIFKAGEDMESNQISWYAQDTSAGTPIVKDSYRPFIKISELMKIEDALTSSTITGKFQYPASYHCTSLAPSSWPPHQCTMNAFPLQ